MPDDAARQWTLLSERVVHAGWLAVASRRYRLPDGTETDWEVHVGKDSVGVIALTPDDRLVMVRQFRQGPDRVVLNVPGGMVDEGESVADAARRELAEETGYVCGSVEVVASFPGFASSSWVKHVAIARGCVAAGEQQLDPFEDCEVVVMDVSDVRTCAKAGEMTGTDLVYVGLDHAGLL